MAGAYVKVGDVQGRPFNPNLGDTAGARASYDKAVAIYESLGARTTRDASLRRELATAYLRLSEIVGATGGTAEALKHAKTALALQREAAGMSPAADGRQRWICSASSSRATRGSATCCRRPATPTARSSSGGLPPR